MAPTTTGSKSQGQRGTQHTISRFFSSSKPADGSSRKRARSPVDLTLDSDEELQSPATKRVKLAGTSPTQPSTSQSSSSPSRVSQYSYVPAENATIASTSTSDEPVIGKQQEARRKLLQEALKQTTKPSNRGRSSLTADEAEHTQTEEDDEGSDSSSPAGRLREQFASRVTVSRHGAGATSAKAKKGKTKEIGPSGEPYTPLQLQVKQLKEENPGTLLMFEVGYKYRFVNPFTRLYVSKSP